MGQVLRGFSVGNRGYGYASVPDGDTKYDKKGRLRADGFKLVIVPEEARVVPRIFRDFIDGKAINKIAKEMNDEHVQTKARLKGGWDVSTLSRILKDEKYTGKFVWNRTTTARPARRSHASRRLGYQVPFGPGASTMIACAREALGRASALQRERILQPARSPSSGPATASSSST
jgi:hypothetical protein